MAGVPPNFLSLSCPCPEAGGQDALCDTLAPAHPGLPSEPQLWVGVASLMVTPHGYQKGGSLASGAPLLCPVTLPAAQHPSQAQAPRGPATQPCCDARRGAGSDASSRCACQQSVPAGVPVGCAQTGPPAVLPSPLPSPVPRACPQASDTGPPTRWGRMGPSGD